MVMKTRDEESEPWGTWDELLLGFAVKRHGLQDWDSVVTELRTKSSLPRLLLTAHHCKLKFQDLKRRFSALYDSIFENRTPERDITIPWLDELRKLRVAELKQEVRNCDVSIQFLETKVKTLEEERDLSVRDDGISEGQRDLDEQPERSENDKGDEPERTTGDSDRENHSVNESNTTGSKGKSSREEGIVGLEPDPTGSRGPGSVPAPERSDDGSSGSVAKSESETDFGTDSAARGNSEVQSSASLSGTRKRKGRQRTELPNRGGPSQGLEVSVKSQPFVRVLEMIRGHRNGSMFERRFESQESEEYETLVKQHVDLETVQSRLDSGTYASCTLAFYRDLLLLFNNATLFFPNSSPESITAYQLRHLVLNEIPEGNNLYPKESSSIPNAASPSQPKPELERPQSLLAKHNSSAPILVCRKRSSISGRPNSSGAASGQKDNEATDDKKPALDPNSQPPKPSSDDSLLTTNAKEKPVTRVRSLRRSNKNPTENDTTSGSSKKQTDTSSGSKPRLIQKLGTPKTEKKKKAEAVTSEKKGSAADFLKRIKRNSPREKLKGSSSKEERRHKGKGGDRKEGRVLRQSGNKKPVKEEISSPSKRSVGRPPRKAAEAPAVSVKRGKEASATKRPRKRARR